MCEHAASSDARAMRLGTYSAWLTKVKRDGAKTKWFSGATKRYFTIDFTTKMVYYSHSEDKKTISQPVRFRDITHAEHLPRPAEANKVSKEHTFGFVLGTYDRSFELFTSTYLDAQHWIDALNAAREIGLAADGGPSLTAPQPGTSDRELSRSSVSTTADGGSDVGPGWTAERPPLQAPEAAPWTVYGTSRSSSSAARPPPPKLPLQEPLRTSQASHSRAPHSQQGHQELLPAPGPIEQQDPFAALEALEELAGPLPPQPEPGVEYRPSGGAGANAALLNHARLMVTNPEAARAMADPRLAAANVGAGFDGLQATFGTVGDRLPLPLGGPFGPGPGDGSGDGCPSFGIAGPAPPAPLPALEPEYTSPAGDFGGLAAPPLPGPGDLPAPTLPEVSGPFPPQNAAPLPVFGSGHHDSFAAPAPPTMQSPSYHSSDSPAAFGSATASSSTAPAATPPPAPAPPSPMPPLHTTLPAAASSSSAAPAPAAPMPAPLPQDAAPAPAPPLPAAAEPGAGWDSDEEDGGGAPAPLAPAPAPAPPAPAPAPAPPAPAPLPAAGPASGFGGSSDYASSPSAMMAPTQGSGGFVQARGPAPVRPRKSSDADLDDLVGEMMDANARDAGHGLVDNFHCLSCDFRVMRIDEFIWSDNVDYLFFRNNYPTFEKLRGRMNPQEGCSAYCCQCSWKSAHTHADLADVAAGLRWRQI